MSISHNSVTVQNGAELSLVVRLRKIKTVMQSCLNLREQSIIKEWRFSWKGEMVYFATRVDCVFLIWVS